MTEEGLVVKLMAGALHQTVAVGLSHLLDRALLLTLPDVLRQLTPIGSPREPGLCILLCDLILNNYTVLGTRIMDRCKEPDGGFRPKARDSDTGTLVIEVGDPESIAALRRNVDTWFLSNQVSFRY